MDPRIREDNGKGEGIFRLGTGCFHRNNRWARGLEADEWRFPNRPYEGVGRTAYNGRPQGSPLQGKDGGVGEGEWVPASARTTGGGVGGGGAVPEAPLRGVGRTAYNGRPQGSPLQGEDGRGGGRGMDPRIREDNGRGVGGGRFPNRPYEGVGRTAYNGRPQGSPLQEKDGGVGEGEWIPAFARTTGGGSRGGARFPNRPYEGLAYKGRPQGSPLRKEWEGTGDGSPHARGQREGESGGRAVPEPPLRGVSI